MHMFILSLSLLPHLSIFPIHSVNSDYSLLVIPNSHHCLLPCMKRTLLAASVCCFPIIRWAVVRVWLFLRVVIVCCLSSYSAFDLALPFQDSHSSLWRSNQNSTSKLNFVYSQLFEYLYLVSEIACVGLNSLSKQCWILLFEVVI